MVQRYHHTKFTDDQIKQLSENKFTSKVDYHHIWFTLEFQNLFLERYEKGESSVEIFTSMGYDVSQNISPSLLVLVWKFPFAWRVNS